MRIGYYSSHIISLKRLEVMKIRHFHTNMTLISRNWLIRMHSEFRLARNMSYTYEFETISLSQAKCLILWIPDFIIPGISSILKIFWELELINGRIFLDFKNDRLGVKFWKKLLRVKQIKAKNQFFNFKNGHLVVKIFWELKFFEFESFLIWYFGI